MDNQKFGKFIKELRKKSNMTQKELGVKLNVTDKAVSKWERGLSFPDITIINSLAETFGITSSEILNAELGKKEEIDIEKAIQEAVEKELDNVVTKYNPDSTLALVMDPNSGEVLAMSSRPNFDSNNYKNYNLETINRNLPIWMTYEPGSTFKIITLSSAINEGKVNLFDDHYYDGGSIQVENARIKCWKRGGHGSETFLNVVENSCNLGVTTRTFLSFLITP